MHGAARHHDAQLRRIGLVARLTHGGIDRPALIQRDGKRAHDARVAGLDGGEALRLAAAGGKLRLQ